MNRLKIWLNMPRVIPHVIFYILCRSKRGVVNKDILVRPRYRDSAIDGGLLVWQLCCALIDEPEFRNIFYMRIGAARHLLNIFLPKISSMRLSRYIAEGFCPIHSYSTIINGAVRIGRNCTVYHCVTIGVERTGVPVIGDNVTIGAGAIIIGGVRIGDNVNIGAGAIVVDDVPSNSTVVCEKARVIHRIR